MITQEYLVSTLADVMPDAGVQFGPGFMEQRPSISAQVANIIGLYSDLEFQQGILLHSLLKTSADTAFTLYGKLRGTSQNGVLLEFAKREMAPAALATFQKIMNTLKVRADERNKLAHWLWGKSDQMPDALLLIQPANWYRPLAYTMDMPMPAQDGIKHRLDYADILVYREHDLSSIKGRMESTHRLLYSFIGVIRREDRAEVAQECSRLETQFGLPTGKQPRTRGHD